MNGDENLQKDCGESRVSPNASSVAGDLSTESNSGSFEMFEAPLYPDGLVAERGYPMSTLVSNFL